MAGRDGPFFPSLFLLCRTVVVELRCRSRSDTQSLSPHTAMRLSRKGIHPADVPSFLLFQTIITVIVTWRRTLIRVQFAIREASFCCGMRSHPCLMLTLLSYYLNILVRFMRILFAGAFYRRSFAGLVIRGSATVDWSCPVGTSCVCDFTYVPLRR